jgi:hypothetical protein
MRAQVSGFFLIARIDRLRDFAKHSESVLLAAAIPD